MGKVIYLRNNDQPGERPECRRAEYLRRNTETAFNLALTGDYEKAMGLYHCLAEACKLWMQEDGDMISAGNPLRWWDRKRRRRLGVVRWAAVAAGLGLLVWSVIK